MYQTYVYKRRFLDTQYGIRKDGDIFKIGDSSVLVVRECGIKIKEKVFRVSEKLWELLTRKSVNKVHVASDDLRTYKKILLLSNAHLMGYNPGGFINVSQGKTFRLIFATLSRGPKDEVSNRCYAVHGKVLRRPPGNYITILPNRHISRPSTSSLKRYLGKTNLTSEPGWNSRKLTLSIDL